VAGAWSQGRAPRARIPRQLSLLKLLRLLRCRAARATERERGSTELSRANVRALLTYEEAVDFIDKNADLIELIKESKKGTPLHETFESGEKDKEA